MEQKQFIYKGADFKIKLGGIDLEDYIIVDKKTGPLKVYRIDNIYANKRLKDVQVGYSKWYTDQPGEIIKGTFELKDFNATTQEQWWYFYSILRDGAQLDKMCINGLLIEKYGFMCFDAAGNFYTPIWFNTTSSIDSDGSYNLTITIEATLPNEVYTYKLVGTDIPAQSSNIFTGLTQGEYTIQVTSPLSIPCIQTIVL